MTVRGKIVLLSYFGCFAEVIHTGEPRTHLATCVTVPRQKCASKREHYEMLFIKTEIHEFLYKQMVLYTVEMAIIGGLPLAKIVRICI